MGEASSEQVFVEEVNKRKAKWDLRKIRLDVIVASLGIALAVAFTSGTALLFLYFLRHSFYPGGISASDTISLSFLPVGFLIITLVGLAFMTLAAFPISWSIHRLFVIIQKIRNKKRLKNRGNTPAGEVQLLIGMPRKQVWSHNMNTYKWVGCALLCLLLAAFTSAGTALRNYIGIMFCAGFWLSIFFFGTQIDSYSIWPKPTRSLSKIDSWLEQQSFAFRKVIIASAVTIAIVSLCIPINQDASMLAMGYRKHDVSVRLNKDDFLALAELATNAGYTLNACRPLDGPMPTIHHMDVLWHALGANALLRYPALPLGAPEALERTSIEFEPVNTSLTILRNVRAPYNCLEFLVEEFFQDSRTQLMEGGWQHVSNQFNSAGINRLGWRIHLVIIDPTEPNLIAIRTEALRQKILRQYHFAPVDVISEIGRTDLKRACDDPASLRLCKSINRRIEIRYERRNLTK